MLNTSSMHLVVVVICLLHDELLVRKVDGERANSDSKTRKRILKAVETGELALVSPSVSLSPGVATHVVIWKVKYLIGAQSCTTRKST